MAEAYWCKESPNVPRVWSSSSLGTISECPRKFELSYVEGWQARGDRLDFDFGIAYHRCLETYWKTRIEGRGSHDFALDTAVHLALVLGRFLTPPTRQSNAGKTLKGLVRAVVWYFEAYPPEEDINQIVSMPDGKPALEMHFTIMLDLINPDGEPYQLQGYLDSLRNFAGNYTTWDYKTTGGSISDFYLKKFKIDIQNHVYTLAARVLTSQKFTWFMIDAVGIGVSYCDYRRDPVELTPGELDEALLDIHSWIRQAERFAEQNYYPKNTKACTFCQFDGICDKDPEVRERFLTSDFDEKRRTTIEVR